MENCLGTIRCQFENGSAATLAAALSAAFRCCPEKVSILVLNEIGSRIGTITSARERMHHGLCSIPCNLEHGAAMMCATACCSVEIAVRVLQKTGKWCAPVEPACEVVQSLEFCV